MDYYTLVFGSIIALSFLYTLAKLSSRVTKKLPPGPSPWPIIGNIHLLGAKPHVSLANLAKTYGPIMSLKLGQVTTVVISSSTMAKQVLKYQDQDFTSRFAPDAVQVHNYCKYSVGWLPVCPQWRKLRRILNTNMFSTNSLDANQHLRSRKVKELIAYCARCSQEGEALDVGQVTFKTNLNMLSNTLFSKDLADPFSDSKVELKDVIWGIMAEIGKPNLADFFPMLKMIDLQGIRRRTTNQVGKLFKLFDDLINLRLEEKRRGSNEKGDVLEAFLNISEESPEEINHNNIKSVFLVSPNLTGQGLIFHGSELYLRVYRWPIDYCMHKDLFTAAADTTTNTVEWAMAEILKQPEIMKKAQVELAETIGKGKLIEEADVSRLTYLQCIIKETLRMHPPTPLVPRGVTQDVELCDYVIPEGSQVLINVWAIGRDFTFWEDPLMFKPERFWSSDLDMQGQHFELIPFSAGRRMCPGYPMTLRMIPVIVGSLLNSFNWKLEADIDEPKDLDMEEKFGLTLVKAHPLRAIPSTF